MPAQKALLQVQSSWVVQAGARPHPMLPVRQGKPVAALGAQTMSTPQVPDCRVSCTFL